MISMRRLAALMLLALGFLEAQVYYSTLLGTVRDSTGAVVVSATVTATNTETGVQTVAATSADGVYRLPTLRPGTYRLHVAAPGLADKAIEGITLFVAQTTRVDVMLEVGTIEQSITVSGAASLVQTESAERGGIMERKEVEALPLATRNFVELTYLMPGVIKSTYVLGSSSAAPSVNGHDIWSNVYYVDGGNLTSMYTGMAAEKINVDTIQEYKLESSNFGADRGIKAGSSISVATVGGTNNLHGTLFEYLRNDKLNGRNFFAATIPPLRYNQFGGFLGGPVRRNKLFFLGSFEASRERRSSVARTTTLTAAERQGNFTPGTGNKSAVIFNPFDYDSATGLRRPFPDNQIPKLMFSPVALKYLPPWPEPNQSGFPNFIHGISEVNDMTTYSGRVDYNISSRDIVYGRFSRQSNPYVSPGSGFPNAANGTQGETQAGRTFVAAWTRMLSATSMNEMRASYAKLHPTQIPTQFYGQNLAKDFGFSNADRLPQGLYGCPQLSFSGVSTSTPCRSSQYYIDYPSTTFMLTDDYSFQRGAHRFKAGFLTMRYYMRYQFGRPGGSESQFTGRFTSQMGNLAGGQPAADFLLGVLKQVRVNETMQDTQDRKNVYQFYFMDDWKVNRKLTLQLGLRYDMNLPGTVANGRSAAWLEGLQSRNGQSVVFPGNAEQPLKDVLKGAPLGFPMRFSDNDWMSKPNWRNFGPRIGVAYRPFGDTRTVVRGGFGIYYDLQPLNVQDGKGQGPPFFALNYTPARPTEFEPPPYRLGDAPYISPSLSPGMQFGSGYTSGPDYRDTRFYDWSLTIQRDLGHDLMVEAAYVGNCRGNGFMWYAWNRIYPVGYTFHYEDGSSFTIGPDTTLQQRQKYPELVANIGGGWPTIHTMYNAFQFYLSKRFTRNFSFRFGYTRSRAYGVDGLSAFQDEWNLSTTNYLLHNSRPNNVFATYVWQLPGQKLKGPAGLLWGGWQLSGIMTFISGEPIDINESVVSYSGAVYQKATLLDGRQPNLSASERTLDRWFDTSAFVRPADNQFGSNASISAVRGPATRSINASLVKFVQIREGHRLQVRADVFNLPNHAPFSNPNNSHGSPTFGRITSAGNGREFQLGLKYQF